MNEVNSLFAGTGAIRWSGIASKLPSNICRLGLGLLTTLYLDTVLCTAQSIPAMNVNPSAGLTEGFLMETNGLYGWSFQISATVMITGLAVFDLASDGLNQSHEVSLWKDESGLSVWPFIDWRGATFLASLSIPAGSMATLDRVWRRVDFDATLTLGPGGYCVMSTYNSVQEDSVSFFPVAPELTDPRFTVGAPMYTIGPDFKEQTAFVLAAGADLGPMLFVQQVPEPSSAALVLAASLFWCMFRSRR